jgi:DNA ligase-1
MSAPLLVFALANDAAAATASKLAKQSTLAVYFRSLPDDEDLRRAVRYAAGQRFATTADRTLGVGGRAVGDVLLSLLRLKPDALYNLAMKHGELGEALSEVWPVAPIPNRDPQAGDLRLADLAEAFEDLSRTGIAQRKREMLADLFSRCRHPREATYLVKIIFGDMRTGLQEGVLQAAIAEAFDKPLADIQRCQLLLGDLDEVAVLARHDRLSEAKFGLFHPIQFMLATPQESAADAAATLDGRAFWAEDKLDGIRAQVHKSGDRIHIYTRTMDRADESFPDVIEPLKRIPAGEFLLDGEIVPWKDGCCCPSPTSRSGWPERASRPKPFARTRPRSLRSTCCTSTASC